MGLFNKIAGMAFGAAISGLGRVIFGTGGTAGSQMRSSRGGAGNEHSYSGPASAKPDLSATAARPVLKLPNTGWKSLLGWGIALSFVWEAICRPIIALLWPDAPLPPSFLQETMRLLAGIQDF